MMQKLRGKLTVSLLFHGIARELNGSEVYGTTNGALTICNVSRNTSVLCSVSSAVDPEIGTSGIDLHDTLYTSYRDLGGVNKVAAVADIRLMA